MAQPDFRARPVDPALLQQLIQAKTQRLGTRGAGAIGGVVSGIGRGLQLTQQIGEIKERRQRQKQLAEQLAQVSQVIDADPTLDAPTKEIFKMALPKDPASVVRAITERKRQASEEKIARTKATQQKKQVRETFTNVKAELTREFKKDPKKFKEEYGEEGLNIIGAKGLPFFEKLLQGSLGEQFGAETDALGGLTDITKP